MTRGAIVRWSLLALGFASWVAMVVSCGNQAADEPVAEPAPAPAEPAAPEPPPPAPVAPVPPPPAAPAAPAADGGSPAADAATATECGRPGQPLCPLQAFMKQKMQPAMRGGGEPLAETFIQVAPWAPDPSWNEGDNGWRSTAEAGAAAARANDRAKVQAMCKACHTAWQKRYRAEFRPRPIP